MDLRPEFAREVAKLRARCPSMSCKIDALIQEILERPADAPIAWQDDIHWITESLRVEKPSKQKVPRVVEPPGRRQRRQRYR
jgi:hypothetical protein